MTAPTLIGKVKVPIADAIIEESRVQIIRDYDCLRVMPQEPHNSR